MNDPNSMRRPGSISASGPAGPDGSWNSGAYVYDGAGNITKIGSAWFTYDKVNRLTAGNLYTAPLGGGTTTQQGYTYDPFGNLTAITGDGARNTPTTTATNRLTSGTYDAAGNLTNWNGAAYQYDRFNQMVRMTSGSQDWAYVYTADDERVWSYNLAEQEPSRWTLRDLSGQVLREYLNDDGLWTVGTDYIRRDGQLLAAETRLGRRHFHLDHLGTPRLITNSVGYKTAYHVYYPFGEEATAFDQDGERMKFTGHERDLASGEGAGDDLDYMHARHYSPVMGRFLSVDTVPGSPGQPQSWNRYSYTLGNPLRYVDPNGLEPLDAVLLQLFNTFFGVDLSHVNVNNDSSLVPAGYDGLTLGRQIFLSKGGTKQFKSRSSVGIELVGHELAHTIQYRDTGVESFLSIYIHSYLGQRLGGSSHYQAYKGIVFEEIARQQEAGIRDFLAKNPDILQKLKDGVPLSEDDLSKIDAAGKARVRSGFQFVQGVLIYVTKK